MLIGVGDSEGRSRALAWLGETCIGVDAKRSFCSGVGVTNRQSFSRSLIVDTTGFEVLGVVNGEFVLRILVTGEGEKCERFSISSLSSVSGAYSSSFSSSLKGDAKRSCRNTLKLLSLDLILSKLLGVEKKEPKSLFLKIAGGEGGETGSTSSLSSTGDDGLGMEMKLGRGDEEEETE